MPIEYSPEQVEQAFRLLYRMALRDRGSSWAEESFRLLSELPPGTIDELAEPREGNRHK